MEATEARPGPDGLGLPSGPGDAGSAPEGTDLAALAARVEDAARDVRQLDERGRAAAERQRKAIEAFHRAALVAIVRGLRDDDRGAELLLELAAEPEVRAVLLLHGILRPDPAARAAQVLASVRPYLESHGGDVELVEVRDGVAWVRLHGACSGCSMSAVTLKQGVEEALTSAIPEIVRVDTVPADPQEAGAAPLQITMVEKVRRGWTEGPAVDAVPDGAVTRIELGGEAFAVVRQGPRLSAFRDVCAHAGQPIHDGLLDLGTGTLTCRAHGWRYDAFTGESLTSPGVRLTQFPARIDAGRVWIRTA